MPSSSPPSATPAARGRAPTARRRCGHRPGFPRSTAAKSPSGWSRRTSPPWSGASSAATSLAVEAGLDGVEINAGQHSLIRQFLSGLTNHRDDEWGGDRLRFATDVLAAVRAAAPDAVVGLRLSCDELAPWAGIVPEAVGDVTRSLAPFVDYVTVVRGAIFSVAATRPDGHTGPNFNMELAAAVRAGLGGGAVVIAQGSIVDVDAADAAIAAGKCGAVEMTRAQIADPELAQKAASAPATIRPCLLCNQTCQVRDNRNPIVTCVVEPESGHEGTEPHAEVPRSAEAVRRGETRTVLIVGGGVAGLECARVSALQGHRVTVVERQPAVGGMARIRGQRRRSGAAQPGLAMAAGPVREPGRRDRDRPRGGAPPRPGVPRRRHPAMHRSPRAWLGVLHPRRGRRRRSPAADVLGGQRAARWPRSWSGTRTAALSGSRSPS